MNAGEITVHGSISTYTNRGCRCADCRAANAAAAAAFRTKQRAQRIVVDGLWVHPTARHGTATAYNAYSCRCRQCTDAHTASRSQSRAS